MIDVVAIGELLIDFTLIGSDHDGYPSMAAHPGGAPANFLAALSRMGFETSLIAKVGRDKFGELLTGTLQKSKVDAIGIQVGGDVFTTLAFVTLDQNGNREFSFARKPGADTQIEFEAIPLSLIDQAKVFHFGTLSMTHEPSRTATMKTVAYAKSKNILLSFDPNLRKPLWSDLNDAKRQMYWGLEQADLVKISDEEIGFLFNCSCEQGAKLLVEEFGVSLVFVTQGKDGCLFRNSKATGQVDNFNDGIKTVDTTGAGDIFGGFALSRILHSGKHPGDLDLKELEAVTTFACAAASLSTEKFGGISSIPDEAAVWDLINR